MLLALFFSDHCFLKRGIDYIHQAPGTDNNKPVKDLYKSIEKKGKYL
jgi:hypothetical protein